MNRQTKTYIYSWHKATIYSWVFLTILLRKALCSYHVLNFRMPEGLRSYKLCSYKKKRSVFDIEYLKLFDERFTSRMYDNYNYAVVYIE